MGTLLEISFGIIFGGVGLIIVIGLVASLLQWIDERTSTEPKKVETSKSEEPIAPHIRSGRNKKVFVRAYVRRDTRAAWHAANPVLEELEIGYETDTDIFRVGNGVTPWIQLAKYRKDEI